MKMRTRIRLIEEKGDRVIFKTYRLNYPFGRKSKPQKILLKKMEIAKKNERRKRI